MGKRKERRLAAMSSAGRRVKLDLFAEPSGDLGGTSAQDEVGEDDESKSRAGLPNSPSSSGQRPENPLLLLGQYSDDELDEESTKGLNHAIVENFLADFDDQVKVAAGKECDETGTSSGKDLAAKNVEQHIIESANVSASQDALQKLEENGTVENDATDPVDLHGEVDLSNSTEQNPVSATCDVEFVGGVCLGWKMVLHEESNRYYYWNTLTGETSWDVPDVLAQGTESTFEQKTSVDTEGIENDVMGMHKSSSSLEVELDDAIASLPNDGSKADDPNFETKEIHEHRLEMELGNDGYTNDTPDDKNGGHDINQSDGKVSSGPISALYYETSSAVNFLSSRQSDDVTGADSEKYIRDRRDNGENEMRGDLSSCLVRHGEYLLERLKSLQRSKDNLQGHDQISKCMLEVEIRLSDIKSLLSYGSLLLPFWLHSERQIKQLEAAINDEFFQLSESANMIDVAATRKSQESIGADIIADAKENKAICSTSEDSQAFDYVSTTAEIRKDSCDEAYNNAAVHTEHVSSVEYPNTLSDSGAGGKGSVHGVAIPAVLTPNTLIYPGEDVDMDVEMEVEDAIPASNTDALGAQYCAPPEQPIVRNPPAKQEFVAPEEGFGVPPPPDDDWIPPPPPDNEPLPPPPPDEPPESSFPPPPDEPPESSFPPPSSDSETVQPFAYAEQYSLTYPGSNFEYYGQTNTEIPGSDFYAHAEGFQVAVPLPPLYYEAMPNTYASAAAVVVNTVEAVPYYSLQDGTVPPIPVVSGVESSGLHDASNQENLGSGQIGMVEAHTEVVCSSLPNTEVYVSAVDGETEKVSIEVPFASASVQAPAVTCVTPGISVLSTPAVATTAVAVTATDPKVQSKVSRNKKRKAAVVSTLRSNKKVSTLVDKWKAAKEELHEDDEEDEDEPENAYEFLEKKRRREIEEWRAQQIASGEAKDNANFQPLGGDWRERVKRKKAQLRREAQQTPSKDLADGNQQPDLKEHARDLPSGWQAYWDESSKQFYYGNTVTLETTWIRPTN